MYLENVSGVGVCCIYYTSGKIIPVELSQLSGVAAILRFPLPQLDEDSEDSDAPD